AVFTLGSVFAWLDGLTLVSAGPTSFWGNVAFAGGAVFGYCDFGKCRFSRILRFFETYDFRKKRFTTL
ncbi:hypothetical protein PL375_07095, partial [Bifidobacterium adolescentis]|nr:hypothetical protein [Bifidobacterium adolescentis]